MVDLPLRYRINEAVFNAQSGNINDATESILAIIREALLSEPAVDAAMQVIEYRSQEETAAQDWKEERDDWKEAVSAAWDSVMGGGDV